MFLFSSLRIPVSFPPPPAMIVKASQSTRSNQCFLTPSPLGSCCQNKKSESPIITAACDSVALANGCSDHLLDGCGRKTTAARGRAVGWGGSTGTRGTPCDPPGCLHSCVRRLASSYEHECGWEGFIGGVHRKWFTFVKKRYTK